MEVYGWQPEPFLNTSLSDEDDEFAQEANRTLGTRLNPNYIGVTCDGEVRFVLLSVVKQLICLISLIV